MLKFTSLLIIHFLLLISCSNLQQGDSASGEKKEMRPLKNAISGKVVGISDGDTFKLLLEGNRTVRVRLYGVDAPERAQDYGTQARQELSRLVFSKEIQVEQKNKDRYGRIVGVAYVEDINVNEELLNKGFVWHYKEYDKSEKWDKLEKDARRKKAGLWSLPNPTPPWQWRKEKRMATTEENG